MSVVSGDESVDRGIERETERHLHGEEIEWRSIPRDRDHGIIIVLPPATGALCLGETEYGATS